MNIKQKNAYYVNANIPLQYMKEGIESLATVTVNIPDTTFVSSAQPDNNFSFYPLIYTGTDAVFGDCIGLMNISLPTLPVTMVDSAKLQLSVIVKSGTEASPIVVNRVTESFLATTVTYTTRPPYSATASGINITPSDLYQTVEIDITTLVNQWLSGTYANNGIALTNSDGATVVQFATDHIVYEPYFPKLTLTYSESPVGSSAICFTYAQLAHIIEQIIALYPTNVITAYTNGFNAAGITGTPYQLYSSPDGTFGGLFILLDGAEQGAVPLYSISAISIGDGSVYDPSITYLTPSALPAGCDKNIISAIHDYLQEQTDVDMYLGTLIQASGTIYKNEYGITVLADAEGNAPIFIPSTIITAIVPTTPTEEQKNSKYPRISSIK